MNLHYSTLIYRNPNIFIQNKIPGDCSRHNGDIIRYFGSVADIHYHIIEDIKKGYSYCRNRCRICHELKNISDMYSLGYCHDCYEKHGYLFALKKKTVITKSKSKSKLSTSKILDSLSMCSVCKEPTMLRNLTDGVCQWCIDEMDNDRYIEQFDKENNIYDTIGRQNQQKILDGFDLMNGVIPLGNVEHNYAPHGRRLVSHYDIF